MTESRLPRPGLILPPCASPPSHLTARSSQDVPATSRGFSLTLGRNPAILPGSVDTEFGDRRPGVEIRLSQPPKKG